MSLPYQPGCPNCEAVRAFWHDIDEQARAIPGGPTGWQMMCLTIEAENVPQCREHLSDPEYPPEAKVRSAVRKIARAAVDQAVRQTNDEMAAVHRAMRGTHMNIVAAEESRKLRRRPK